MTVEHAAPSVSIADIHAARAVISKVAKRTPIVSSSTLTERHGRPVVLKAENLQRTGAFKIRGAMNKVAQVAAGGTPANGVTTASAGNHAQALALAARHFGVRCEIFVPSGAPVTKIAACRAQGADVVEVGTSFEDAMAAAEEQAHERRMILCHPFDDPAVVAGQGTLGLELVEDIDDLKCVVVPLGGGGLASGVAIAVKSLVPAVRVVGVQAAQCAPYTGGPSPSGPVVTLADGIAIKRPGELTGPLISDWVDEIVSVDEDAIADAMVMLMDRAKLYVEGAGAVGVAALQSEAMMPDEAGTTCVVLSGGNVDLGVVPGLIRRHETAAGRRLVIFARIDDRPGSLVRLLGVFATARANLVEVQHEREGVNLHVRQTGVHATFEVRSADHARKVVEAARAGGYPDLQVLSEI
jgi:threonine dehydratase